jgi:hypothetical protein
MACRMKEEHGIKQRRRGFARTAMEEQAWLYVM